MAESYSNFDKPYRRGLVLGLSLAELFLILLFLLLLVSMGLTAFIQEELDAANKKNETLVSQNQELTDSLTEIQKILGGEITVVEFTRLVKDVAARQKLIRQNEQLVDQLSKVNKELKTLSAVSEVLKKYDIQPDALTELIEGKEDLAEALAKNTALRETIVEQESKMKAVNQELVQAEIEAELARSLLEEAKKQISEKQDKIVEISKILDAVTDKGRNPPCWFRLVDDKSEPGAKRQRDVKIFDVKIEDDGFVVIKHNNDKTPKPIEFGDLSSLPLYPDSSFNKKLSQNQFSSIFKTFYMAGENNKIQPYKCMFTVDVYDRTSNTNKTGYKRSLNTIEGMFGTFMERGEWPVK